jgi:hypothetical protein
MHEQPHRSEGMALLLALFFATIAITLLTAVSLRLFAERTQVNHFELYNNCFNGLEAGYSQCKALIEAGQAGQVGIGTWMPVYGKFVAPTCASAGVAPLTLSTLPDVSYMAYAQNWYTDGMDNNKNGFVDDGTEHGYYTIWVEARDNGKIRRVESVLRGLDVNVWRNAIFAGSGQAGGLINGNVSIHGSVHLLGDNLPSGGTAVTALDLSGTSLIHNNYVGVPATLAQRVPALSTTTVNGETAQTMDAKLRVKHGLVGISGNAEIGGPNMAGNAYKETLDGTYVNDGWTGTSVNNSTPRGVPSHVYSDNGWDALYDLGDKVPFPLLTDDWRDPNTGAKVWNSSTNAYYTHQDYFEQVLLADPNSKTDGVYAGDMTIDTGGGHFYWNATKNTKLTGSLPTTPPASTDDYILYNATTALLTINGQIYVNGNLNITGKANKKTINYTGRGAILASGTTTLNCDLLTCNGGDVNNITNSFPANNCLGIMSVGEMDVGTTSQLSLMGAFYSATKIYTSKQSTIMGTFVSQYFDMGTNVPSIYQVPNLADSLPLGMIGNYPLMSMTRVSWRELGVGM